MKKLMIAAAIVCAAVASQAANVNWNWSGTLNNGYLNPGSSSSDYTGKEGQAGRVYFINAAQYTQAQVLEALVLGTKTLAEFAVNAGTESAATGYFDTTDGTMSSTKKQKIADHDKFGPTDANGKGIGFVAMLVTYEGSEYVYLSANNTAKVISTTSDSDLAPAVGTTSSKFYGDASAGYTKAGWYSMVPEPTSGLLLLIGVGALALRRRRA